MAENAKVAQKLHSVTLQFSGGTNLLILINYDVVHFLQLLVLCALFACP